MPVLTASNYDKRPRIDVPGHACQVGWKAIGRELDGKLANCNSRGPVVVVECYPGVDELEVADQLAMLLKPALTLLAASALKKPEEIDALVEPFLGGDDPVFGFLSDLTLPQFFDAGRLDALQQRVRSAGGIALIVGCGASLIAPDADLVVYADLARWEAQLRFRRNESSNLGAQNPKQAASLQYKRAFFVDWRVADRFKLPLLERCDYVLDTNTAATPKLAAGGAVREGLRRAAARPFRVVPFFDPAPWGGQWMKETCDLDRSAKNYGWCFDCVPEENSLLLGFGEVKDFEIPSINVVFRHPEELLGGKIHARFGAEFPIRFDLLDTMGGGNLSLQVHPLNEYIRDKFGMPYTQDESYYMLDAGPEARVYLGFKTGVDPEAVIRDLKASQTDPSKQFPADDHANRFPAKKHDHFLIPAGTIHCSGSESMVLEISATPYIFTFKLWDWARLGLDGKPRHIHLDHGKEVLQFDRDTEWTKRNLVNRIEPIASGDGWTEERTGLHESEFIETRRHWFTGTVEHDTEGNLNVVNLVEGREAIVESPTGAFEPFVVHYAETFIVPAAVGGYTIRPHGESVGQCCGTLKAFVR
ncbi:class I mannose-6-phosphate isomerase [Luteolibacter arcticus]|uniref:Class I mannose-6-phosphate isomerase n=1 Tax=Luteolibacter arcticus TaxID=1581411 RepID=A0ABT3GNI3_9BACT|nr:class I mannose-6-phosphate isomerase [Luteolibacter arcticus]MCW1925044.1 class I mannose-6-phosphate isomerase [Luteolibacter arcticus]